MTPEFWHRTWQEGRIGFHEGAPNRFLARHAHRFESARRVLVPLCGKTEDLAYLAGLGHEVVGVELSEAAGRAFFAEHGLVPTQEQRGAYLALSARSVTILVGDYFAATHGIAGRPNALYDRAALIALPPELREKYVTHTRALLSPGSCGLLVTLEYEAGALEGPPFSVPAVEVASLWSGVAIEALERERAVGARFADGALAFECGYWLGESSGRDAAP